MICEHEFNSRWRGKRAGILRSLEFFDLAVERRRELLAPFSWVELHVAMKAGLPLEEIRRTDFYYVDTQLNFRVVLGGKMPPMPGDAEWELRTAEDPRFQLSGEEWSPFAHERYQFLPGTSQECIDRRFKLWASDLVSQNPSCCLELLTKNGPQGWFLARPSGGSAVNLTLAVLHRKARISGFEFYARCLAEYARLGYRSGSASFSILHTAVHNIYAQLGARFETPVGIWFWVREA
jgi:hypothetical protein